MSDYGRMAKQTIIQGLGCALLFGIFLGIFGTLACRACAKAGWHVQAPITRTAQ